MTSSRFNPPPGWPEPPQGWSPDPQWRPDPTWPPAPPGWQFWVPGYAPAPSTAFVMPTVPARSKGLRTFLTCLIVLGPFAVIFVVAAGAVASIDPNAYLTQGAYDRAVSNATDTVTGVAWVGYLVAYALLARRVSYRWFDTFFQLIPIYGVYWQFRIAWRLTYLPHRDWQVPPGEQLSPWAPVPGPSYPSPGAVPAVPHQPYPGNVPGGPHFSSGYGSVPPALDPYTPPM